MPPQKCLKHWLDDVDNYIGHGAQVHGRKRENRATQETGPALQTTLQHRKLAVHRRQLYNAGNWPYTADNFTMHETGPALQTTLQGLEQQPELPPHTVVHPDVPQKA